MLKERIDVVQERQRRLFSRMDEVVILKHKAENKETSSTHDLLRSSVEIEQQRLKRETKLKGIRVKADTLAQEFEATATAFAGKLLIESVACT